MNKDIQGGGGGGGGGKGGHTGHEPDEEGGAPKETFVQALTDPDGNVVKAKLAKVSELGRGGFGFVLKMSLKLENHDEETLVAVKFPYDSARDLVEKDVLVALKKHPNICGLMFYFTKNSIVNLVFEFLEGGDLFFFMKKRFKAWGGLKTYTELFTYQTCRALAYCHSKFVVHRDLKPENLMVSEKTGRLKLCDFGCAAFMHNPNEDHINYVGTRDFRAPELIFGATKYTSKVDMWGVGVVLTEMLRGASILSNCKDTRELAIRIITFLGEPTADDCKDMKIEMMPWPKVEHKRDFAELFKSKALLNLLNRTIVFKPSARITAWEICAHPFLKEVQDKDYELPNGFHPKYLFNFSKYEVSTMPDAVRSKLQPLM